MSKLREQLEAARSEYQSQSYPGDLVRDVRTRVNPKPATLGFIGRATRVGLAIAALIAVAVIGWNVLRPELAPVNVVAEVQPTERTTTDSADSIADVTPPSLATISVPSWSDVASADASTDATTQPVSMAASWPAMPSFPSLDQIPDRDAASSTKSSNSFSDEETQ